MERTTRTAQHTEHAMTAQHLTASEAAALATRVEAATYYGLNLRIILTEAAPADVAALERIIAAAEAGYAPKPDAADLHRKASDIAAAQAMRARGDSLYAIASTLGRSKDWLREYAGLA